MNELVAIERVPQHTSFQCRCIKVSGGFHIVGSKRLRTHIFPTPQQIPTMKALYTAVHMMSFSQRDVIDDQNSGHNKDRIAFKQWQYRVKGKIECFIIDRNKLPLNIDKIAKMVPLQYL